MDVIANGLGANYNGQHNIVDCANRTSLPNIDFYFGEAKLTMAASDYSWKYFVSIALHVTFSHHLGRDSTMCSMHK